METDTDVGEEEVEVEDLVRLGVLSRVKNKRTELKGKMKLIE